MIGPGDPAVDAEIARRLLWVLLAIFGIGAVVIGVLWSRERHRERQPWVSYGIEVAMLGFVFGSSYLGPAAVLPAALLLGTFSTAELYAALGRRFAPAWPRLGFLLGWACIAVPFFRPGSAALLALGVGALALGFAAVGRWRSGGAGSAARTATTLLGVVYPAIAVSFWLELSQLQAGFGYLVLCYALIETSDAFAWLLGNAFGRHPIFPRLSPRKTWEGTLGGAVATVGVAFALRFAVPGFGTASLVAATLLLVVLGQAGDLLASAIKRHVGIKDFSSRVPTHGGVLDVYDSLILALPAFYAFVWLVG